MVQTELKSEEIAGNWRSCITPGLSAIAPASILRATCSSCQCYSLSIHEVQVFDARCVIKICMNEQVREAAMRLLDNAEVIKQVVNLRGACIALDDCYEVRHCSSFLLRLWTRAIRHNSCIANQIAWHPVLHICAAP